MSSMILELGDIRKYSYDHLKILATDRNISANP
jgi:hypothetical protein